MAAKAYQLVGRQSELGANTGRGEIRFIVTGAADEGAAREAVAEALQEAGLTTYDGMTTDSVLLEEIVDEYGQGKGTWEATVRYAVPSLGTINIGEHVYSFDTSGGSVHVTHSRATRAAFGTGATTTKFQQLIGYTDSDGGEVTADGCDITVPQYAWEERYILAGDAINQAFRRSLFLLTGSMNKSDWAEFDAGENLFLGAQGTSRPDGAWEITFRGAGSPNITSADPLEIGSGSDKISVTSKKGWDYLWVYYGKRTTGGDVVPYPRFALVEQVYPEKEHSDLGFGQAPL